MKKCQTETQFCGSEPAHDSRLTGDIDVECSALIASRLAPTWVLCRARDLRATYAALAANFS